MNLSLDRAERYSERLSIDISEERKGIENIGYILAVPLTLAEAEGYAEQGDVHFMNLFLDRAEGHSKRLGIDISEERKGIEKKLFDE